MDINVFLNLKGLGIGKKLENLNYYMKIDMKWQDNGSCVITTRILERNHPNTERNFYCSKNRRKLSKYGENFVLDLIGAKESNINCKGINSKNRKTVLYSRC